MIDQPFYYWHHISQVKRDQYDDDFVSYSISMIDKLDLYKNKKINRCMSSKG